jgi:hypothetical protein
MMTKKEKARRAKAAAASKLYRQRQKTRLLQVAKKTLRKPRSVTITTTKVAPDAVASVETDISLSRATDLINRAAEVAADRVAARFGEKDHIDRMTDEGGKEGPQQAQQGALSALSARLNALLDRAYSIRGRQGNSLVEAVGEREGGNTQPAGNGAAASTPPRSMIIVEQINDLDRVLADLDAQSRIICDTLA